MNFTLSDVVGAVGAFLIFPVVVFAPGYCVGFVANLLGFRNRILATQIASSVVLSISLFPVVAFLMARYLGMWAVWCLYMLTSGVFCFVIVQQRTRARPAMFTPLLCATLVWVAVALLSLVDAQIGERLFVSVTAHDYCKHVAVTDAITRTGVPPVNPSFYPGQPVALYYYYFWFLLCSLVDQLGGSWISARDAVLAGTMWCGIGFMSALHLMIRLRRPHLSVPPRIAVPIGLSLIAVSGLDILPAGAAFAVWLMSGWTILYPTVEWWNEQVAGLLDALLWVPHHLAGLIAGVAGLLILVHCPRRFRVRSAIFAALCFASAAGLSIWVALVLAACGALLLAATWIRGDRARALPILWAGLAAAIISAPFLGDLLATGTLRRSPIAFAVRSFAPAEFLLKYSGHTESLWIPILNAALLPLNYSLELGFFALAAVLYWRMRPRTPMTHSELLECLMLAAGVGVCTFLRSDIKNNDLGWRGFMFAQIVLLLWSIEVLWKLRFRHRFLTLLLFCGVMTTAYDLIIMRIFLPLQDDGKTFALRLFSPDRGLARRAFDARQAYRFLERSWPQKAIVQHNPEVAVDIFHASYGNRQVVAADRIYGDLYGIAPERYQAVSESIIRLFTESDVDRGSADATCDKFGIHGLMVKNTDPLWLQPAVWSRDRVPVFQNPSVRIYPCGTGR